MTQMEDLPHEKGDSFVHLPPRDRLKAHAIRRSEQRLGGRITERDYERKCVECRGKQPIKIVYGRERHDLWHKGRRIAAIYDRGYDAIVTFFITEVIEDNPAGETALAAAFRRAREKKQ